MMFEEVNTEEIIAMKTTTKSDIALTSDIVIFLDFKREKIDE